MTLSASNISINAELETATAALSLSFVSVSTGDSISVTAIQTSGPSPGVSPEFRAPQVSDSVNARSAVASGVVAWVDAIPNTAAEATFYFDLVKPPYAGTYVYTFFPIVSSPGASSPAPLSLTISVSGGQSRPPSNPPNNLSVSPLLLGTTLRGDVARDEGTASAILSIRYRSVENPDSFAVVAVRTSGAASPGGEIGFRASSASDSQNALSIHTDASSAWVNGIYGETVTANLTFDVIRPTRAGTYTYTFYPVYSPGTYYLPLPAPVTFTFTVKRLSIIQLELSGSSRRGGILTLNSRVPANGTVEFRQNGMLIRGCANKLIDPSSLQATCTWKARRHGSLILSATFDSSDASWSGARASLTTFILQRLNR